MDGFPHLDVANISLKLINKIGYDCWKRGSQALDSDQKLELATAMSDRYWAGQKALAAQIWRGDRNTLSEPLVQAILEGISIEDWVRHLEPGDWEHDDRAHRGRTGVTWTQFSVVYHIWHHSIDWVCVRPSTTIDGR